MEEKRNVPKLRFPGFTDPWEQRRLGEVVDVHDGVHQTPDYKDHGVMFVSVEDIETLKSEKYISKEDYDRDYKTRPATGDILMTRIGDVGTSNVVETHDEMAFYVSLALLKPRNIESYFLNSAIKSSFFQKRLQERTLVTAVPKKINKDEIGKVEILLPVAIEEQRQIGAFFRSLDSLIALHQRELDHVKELKKGLLQKVFPKEGTNAPELRFPGFTDPWEQRKLGELVEETYGGGTPKTSVPEYWGGDIPWIQSSNVIEGELFNIDRPKAITDKGLRESAAILIPGSSIAVVTHVGVGKLVYLPFSFTTSQDFVSLSRLKTNSIFLCYALFRRLQTEINMVQGSAIKGITKAELLDKRIDIPHDVEQTQIGAFFQKLDSLIALHQRELDHVKELKKGLLQQMFV